MLFFRSIKFQLTLWYLFVIVLLFALFGAATYTILSYQLDRNLDESLRASAQDIESGLKFENAQVILPAQPSGLVEIYDAKGTLLSWAGPRVEASEGSQIQLAFAGQVSFLTTKAVDGQEVRLFATPFTVAPGVPVVVVVGKPRTDIENVLRSVKSILWLSALAGVVIAAVGGSLLASRAFYPVIRITGTAEDIDESNLTGRIDVHGQDELGKLASTLNRMMERLESAFTRQRQFAADASHELRTPLAVIQAESTLALQKDRPAAEYRKSLQLVSQEAAYMSAMLGNLLFMVRTEAGKEPFNFQTVNINDLLTELSSDIKVLAREKGLSFELARIENFIVSGDRVKLRQLFLNIFENAVRYTPAGGIISGSATASNGAVVISVADTGIGIPQEKIPFIFERFYRVDKARSRAEGGAGLGLAIARYIAEAHGGKIEVESVVGKGSIFRVSLPLTTPDAAEGYGERKPGEEIPARQ